MKKLLLASIAGSLALVLLLYAPAKEKGQKLTESVYLTPGPINGVTIVRDGARLAIYGDPAGNDQKVERVLLTHHRRDVVWAARKLIEAGAKGVAPAAERPLIEKPGTFWEAFQTRRFHDYSQQSTKVLGQPLAIDQWVKEGDVIKWRGITWRVLDTPGFTRGAVSYVVDVDGKRIAFTGDLIYGDGQLFDLYSLQDAIPEAKIRGYHGYASRLAKLIPSLQKVAALKPDMLVPARGPIIRKPQQAIERLIERTQALYHNYLSTNALNWYFKEKRMRICGQRVLGKEADVQLMSYSKYQEQPDWVWNNSTSRLLISGDGHGFLLDCGYKRVIEEVKKLMIEGKLKKVEGIFVTHCHDDHTDAVQAAAEEFKCPVYALEEYTDVLENPHAYHTPALSSNSIKKIKGMKNGQAMNWREFQLTFYFYPGQMFYHGGLLVKKKGHKPIFFIGDSFSPSGMDDYCLLNRNLVHEDEGYLLCLKKLRAFRGNYWIVNEHIPYVFTFSNKELDYLETRYRKRITLLRKLFPWDDPNYGIDEQWAVFYPYGSAVEPGKPLDLEVRLTNHSPKERTFHVTPHVPRGMKLLKHEKSITLKPRQWGRVQVQVQAPTNAGSHLVTADIESNGMSFRRWVEAMVVTNDPTSKEE